MKEKYLIVPVQYLDEYFLSIESKEEYDRVTALTIFINKLKKLTPVQDVIVPELQTK